MNKLIILSLLVFVGSAQASDDQPKRKVSLTCAVKENYIPAPIPQGCVSIAGLDKVHVLQALWCPQCDAQHLDVGHIPRSPLSLEEAQDALNAKNSLNYEKQIYINTLKGCQMHLDITSDTLDVRRYNAANCHAKGQAEQRIAAMRDHMRKQENIRAASQAHMSN